MATWKRLHTLTAGAEITALALSNAHVAVGTACGSVMAWQCEVSSEECKQVDFLSESPLNRCI